MISEQARLYLQENLPPAYTPPPIAAQISTLREQVFNGCQPGIQMIREEFSPTLQSAEFNGVDCLVVSPRRTNDKLSNVKLLYFFGGGYITGSPEEDLPITAVIADQIGIEVICPRYRLAPEHPYPAAIDDGIRVYEYLINSAKQTRILMCGESAGGNLAMQVLLHCHKQDCPMPTGLAMMSPWVDLSGAGDSLEFNNHRDPSLSAPWVDAAAELFAPHHRLTSAAISPLYADMPINLPATLITSGSRDLLLSNCLILANKMRQAGINVDLRIWEHMWHVFEWYPELPEARQSLIEISSFLKSCLE